MQAYLLPASIRVSCSNNLISVFGNTGFTLIVLCILYSIFSCISIMKNCKPKLYGSLDDRADFCTLCHMLD